MKPKSLKGRYAFVLTVMLIASALLVSRLVKWQVIQSDYYDDIAMTSTSYTVTTDALRGEIYDVNGVDLAVNVTGYRVVFNQLYIKEDELNDAIIRLLDIMEQCREKWIDELPITVDKNGGYTFDTKKQDKIDDLKSKDNLNMNPYSTAEECMVKLAEKYDCQQLDKDRQRNVVSVRYNMEQNWFSYSQPYIFAEGVSE
ncbi:MAG: penicillin-binding protein, partial [Clostridia bacterium]|nr:penicillin-binding protein [Clostridia bacterium]